MTREMMSLSVPGAVAPLVLCCIAAVSTCLAGADPVAPIALRAEHFTVTPSTGPVTHVRVQNRGETAWVGTISLKVPDGWKLTQSGRAVSVKPGETERVPFAIERAQDSKDNRYPVEVVAEGMGLQVARKQVLVCASAPYGKVNIDGKTDDWTGAIPVSFACKGKRTTVRTLWNRREFCVLVEVEEDRLVGHKKGRGHCDAVQLCLAPADAPWRRAESEPYGRYEFLLVSAWFRDKCFRLASVDERPSMRRVVARRPLAVLETKDVAVEVKRRKTITAYECAIPFALMPKLEPMVGREFRFSFLIHDAHGTGTRDWGVAAGLWPWQRNPLAWDMTHALYAGDGAPYDSRIEWGFCSSRD